MRSTLAKISSGLGGPAVALGAMLGGTALGAMGVSTLFPDAWVEDAGKLIFWNTALSEEKQGEAVIGFIGSITGFGLATVVIAMATQSAGPQPNK